MTAENQSSCVKGNLPCGWDGQGTSYTPDEDKVYELAAVSEAKEDMEGQGIAPEVECTPSYHSNSTLSTGPKNREYYNHSWERGTNENTNGLLRQFFCKGMDFGMVIKSDVDIVLELLNNRPRKCLNYRTPTEVLWSKAKCCASD